MRRLALLLLAVTSSSALAHDPAGHALHHDWYKTLKVPGTSYSCCNNQDCRPAAWRATPNGVEFFIGGKWFFPPKQSVIETETVDGNGHWCGLEGGSPLTFCAIVPRVGS
jgi:hypothetical protein